MLTYRSYIIINDMNSKCRCNSFRTQQQLESGNAFMMLYTDMNCKFNPCHGLSSLFIVNI